jgi:hypothetical protein
MPADGTIDLLNAAASLFCNTTMIFRISGDHYILQSTNIINNLIGSTINTAAIFNVICGYE